MAYTVSGELKTWHKTTVDFKTSSTFREEAGTFRDFRLDVTFVNAETGREITVPGYFAADGDAADSGATSGSVWRVHFTPPEDGRWSFEAHFRTGEDIAAKPYAEAPFAGRAAGSIDGETGTFVVAETDKTGEDFRAKGMILQGEGSHHLQHQGDGDYFIRGGPGIPENFLAYPDFDGTANGRFDFSTHSGDFNWGDPTWKGGRGSEIIGAVNYLAEQGQNTIYVMPNTAGGDGRDVWPWVGDFSGVAQHDGGVTWSERDRFSTYDVSKLEQWAIVFDHMDHKGIYKNFVLQEQENDQMLNWGTPVAGSVLSVERLVYLREMVARFGHANGIQWNMGEENTNTDAQRAEMARYLKAVDPYDHVVALHTFNGGYDAVYGPLLDDPAFDGPSFQIDAQDVRAEMIKFRDASAAAGDPWVLAWDEDSGPTAIIDPYSNNPDSQNERTLRESFWGTLTAGGSGGNWYVKGSTGHSLDQNYDDFRAHESIWRWTEAATSFFNTHVPFWDMGRHDAATPDPDDFAMSKGGEYYLVYLPYGEAQGVRLDLRSEAGETFDVFWYNPREGGSLIDAGTVAGGAVREIGDAPTERWKDWVLLARNSALPDRPDSVPPDAATVRDQSVRGEFFLNNQVTGDQSDPAIAALPDGGFIAIWRTDDVGQDGNGAAIKARAFDADGAPRGPEILVNDRMANSQRDPAIAALPDGGFAAAWSTGDEAQDGSGSAIMSRVFAADGTPRGPEFLVNGQTAGEQVDPVIAALPDGRFVVAWRTDEDVEDRFFSGIKGRVFDADATPLGAEFLVNEKVLNSQLSPAIAALADGGFVATWWTGDSRQDGNGSAIKARAFDADGAPRGSEFIVNDQTFADQRAPSIAALPGGGFVAAWHTSDDGQDGSGSAIKARAFDADGVPRGAEFLVNDQTAGVQFDPAIAALPDGGFVTAWWTGDPAQDGSGSAIKARAFEADGTPSGAEFLVNEQSESFQVEPVIAALSEGGFATLWSTTDPAQDGSGRAVKGRAFDVSVDEDGDDGAGVEFLPNDGRYYAELASGLSWTEAAAEAARLGGSLVVPDDLAENAFVMETFFDGDPIWLGYSDAAEEGVFVDEAGAIPSYTNWLPGEPNSGAGQDYAAIASADGRWDDIQDAGGWMLIDGEWRSGYEPRTVAEFAPENDLFVFLVDTSSDAPLALIRDGGVVDADLVAGRTVGFYVEAAPGSAVAEDLESMTLALDGGAAQTENIEPYALFGDDGLGDFFDGAALAEGDHRLDLALYDADGARGTLLDEVSIEFLVA